MEQIEKIHKRQLARFLEHLNRTGQLTPSLTVDIKRAFGYVFQDINTALGLDEENTDGFQED